MGAVMSEAGDIQACEALIFAQGYLFELLHKAFGGQPDAEVIGVLASSITADAIEEVESGSETLAKLRRYLGRLGEGAGDDAFLEAAREEYGRFFQGPAAPPAFPWEAPYLTHEPTVFQPSTLEVRAAYREQGLQVLRFRQVPDDHIALMCAFAANMGRRSLEALRAGDTERLRELLASQYRFVEQHMANWLPEYAADALHVKEAILYPQIIQGARALVDQQLVAVGEMLAWLDEPGAAELIAGQERDGDFLAEAEEAYARVAALRPKGIEDNELAALPALGDGI